MPEQPRGDGKSPRGLSDMTMMHLYAALLGLLATWRLTHLLHAEDGPWRVLALLRARLGKAFDCFYCLSLWCALPMLMLQAWMLPTSWPERLLIWPSLSAGAILLEQLIVRSETTTVSYREDPEDDSHVLRTK